MMVEVNVAVGTCVRMKALARKGGVSGRKKENHDWFVRLASGSCMTEERVLVFWSGVEGFGV
jgi:hypothetical protein